MKATSTHIALVAVAMYGVLSATYLYGQANKGPATSRDPAKQTEKTPATEPSSPIQGPDVFSQLYKTVHVERADAAALAKQLRDLIPGATIVGDARTNQIIIHGGKEDIATAENLIKQLDVPTPQKPQAAAGYGGPSGPPGMGGPPMAMGGPPGATAVPGVPGVPAPGYVPSTTVWITPGAKPVNPKVAQANGGSEIANELLKELQPLLAQVDQLKNSGNTEAAQKLQARIEHLLSEETRRAEENTRRAKEIVQRAAEQAQKASSSGDDQLRQTAEQDRKAAEEGQRTAEQNRRAVEQIQRAIESVQRARETAQRAIEINQRIAALSADIRKLESGGELSDKQKSELDEAKQRLKQQLATQFDERQQAEALELKQLRERLDKLEKEISDRAQNRDDQINQRFQELTSPTWQQSSDSRTWTVKTSNLTLENLNGAKQLTLTSPEITISKDITPPAASVDPNAAPELAPEGSTIPTPAAASNSGETTPATP